MTLKLFALITALVTPLSASAQLPASQAPASDLAVVPLPRQVERLGPTDLVLDRAPTVAIADQRLRPLADAFAGFWWRLTGERPAVVQGNEGNEGNIVLALVDDAVDPEGYRLRVDGRVEISGASVAGVAHGAATLLQITRVTPTGCRLPSVAIDDAPDSTFRSVLVDVARQPHTVAVLEQVIDLMFLHKVRYLQLHLTDDQSFTFPFPPVTDALPNNKTIPLEDWRALVAYGEARGVTIVPELDLPGHSTQLKRSGYLEDPTPNDPLTDRDVAHPVNHERLFAIVDAMLDVFEYSPWFHIGGDESGAGQALVPFLAAANRHLRDKPPAERRRLLVWEGFHGAPAELPATGEDHIVVVAWESAYNPPWVLLDAGYTVVNASWKPLYVVGGGAPRYPHIGGRHWSPREIHAWSKEEFWHWQPGTPVFEDRGPGDEHPNDGIWPVPEAQQAQILGGQLLFWEQRQETVLTEAFDRVAALSDRLWAGDRPGAKDPVGFQRRHDGVRERVRSLVQPVRMTLVGEFNPTHPTARDHVWFSGSLEVTCDTPSGIAGEIRLTRDGSPPIATSERYEAPLEVTGDTKLVAQLFVDGAAVGAPARAILDRRPARVWVEWFDLPRRALSYVPDFADRTRWTPSRVDVLPELRGPYRTERPRGQLLQATMIVAAEDAGAHAFRLQTRDGRAKLYVDGELLLGPSEPSEVKLIRTIDLEAGPHRIRVDHASGNISPVVIVAVQGPRDDRFVNITSRLAEIPRGTEPEALQPMRGEVDLLAAGLAGWRFASPSGAKLEEVVKLTEDGVLRISGNPVGYLATERWYRDYELEFEWRWPEAGRPGNSGVLVHTTTPLLFYGWPRSLEVQLQHTRAGDFWTIGEGVDLLVEKASERRIPRRPGNLHSHRRIPRLQDGVERPVGEWNHMRVLCRGEEIVVTVNGVEVNRGIDCTESAGAIAFQSEGAAIEVRRVRIRGLAHVVR
ncbi:MAG: family 16 glycoside hydrolase [Phycisphaerales bacterium JB038]